MEISLELFAKAFDEGKILLYEQELIEKLRNLNYKGFPLSIVLLYREFCNGECHSMSMNISRAMDHFTLVRGDVNLFDLNDECPNHSWVEKDGFVYDTSFGFRWDKDLYYSLFQPNVREVYDEKTVQYDKAYQIVLRQADEVENPFFIKFMIQYIELSETKNPYVNQSMLQKEIDIWREQNSITDRLPDDVMKAYQKVLPNLKNKQGSKK